MSDENFKEIIKSLILIAEKLEIESVYIIALRWVLIVDH